VLKKSLSLCLTVLLALVWLAPGARALEAPHIDAKGAIVGEVTTGSIIYELNADTQLYPASTTKIMTAILALENCEPYDVITVSKSALDGLADQGSSIMLKEGEKMAFMDMLKYLLVSSGNDAANALAEHVSGSVSAFVELMNKKAQELGCTNTHFSNPHGLHDDNHYTTARDLLKIAEYAMRNETFAEIVMIDRTQLAATNMRDQQTISSTNHLISRWRSRDYYYEGAIGIKTGSTTPAGLCLVSGVRSGDLTYITVVLGASKLEDGTMGSFTETIKLLDYAKKGFSVQPLATAADPVAEAEVALGRDADAVTLIPARGVTALLPVDFDTKDVVMDCRVQPDVKAPVEKGDVLGTVTYYYNGHEYDTVDLVAAASIKRSTWLYIVDTIVSIFSSTLFKVVIGLLVLTVLVVILIAAVARRGRRRRSRQYRGRRRR
jgi:D-alanyl-D-alanine carboxypeptidase (penicillin-binding protein 5/6)